MTPVLECVVNISEGRSKEKLSRLADSVDGSLLDLHSDDDHNRAVFTLAGSQVEAAARALAAAAVAELDIREHRGVHPRIGVVDVVPFAPLDADGQTTGVGLAAAIAARDRFAVWAGSQLSLPCFVYGPERSLPDVRRRAMSDLAPDFGPGELHPTAGACCVGARPLLVAYNLLLTTSDVATARRVAAAIRSAEVRALGLGVSGGAQVSCNLIAPERFGPADAYRAVAALADVAQAELVGLVPEKVLLAIPEGRWEELGLSAEATIEARLSGLGLAR